MPTDEEGVDLQVAEDDDGEEAPVRAPLTVSLGGQERELRFTLKAFTAAQQRYDVRYTLAMLAEPSLADVPVLAFIGLLEENPRLTLSKVVGWMEDDPPDVSVFLEKALPRVAEVLGVDLDEEGEPTADAAEQESLDDVLEAPLG